MKREAERRQAAVFYADISGFTAISEKLDPEEVTAVMNGCFEILESIVIAHGGIVNQYIGDCVMASFGLGAGGNGAASPSREAVRAAMEIRSAVYKYNKDARLPSKLDIHIGVNTGPVLAGDIGGEVRREFMVIGDTVAVAAKLEDASDKGQIFVGPETFRDTNDELEFRPLDPIVLRESEPPIPIYELVGVRDRRQRIKRDSERRQATVLFGDIYGFKKLGEVMSPEAQTALLNRCFAILESIVRGYGGVVDKYIGQCLMALFGVPNAIENAPQQAVNAAIEIRNRLQLFNEEEQLPIPLQIHMGVNSGLVIAGEIGGRVKRDFSVMGDTVNLASRLKDASKMGTILIGPETYRYVKDAFELHPIEPLTLKGKAQPVPAYEVRSEKGQVHRARAATGGDRLIHSDLVGREREVEQLRTAVRAAISGSGGIVSLIGEAGLGKSRLLAEVLNLPEIPNAMVLEGRSTSIGQNLSYHPFIDLLRHWAQIADEDPEDIQFEKLERAVGWVIPEEAREVLPFVATLMGMRLAGAYAERVAGIDGEALEKLIIKSTRQLFQRMAWVKPLVLIFEDLHWADQSSIDLLETLLRLVVEHRILFVHVFRPDYEETAERVMRSALETYADRHLAVHLQPLSEHQSATLVENLLKIEDLPFSTRALITRKAEGNPFYIEEVVRSLIDQGAVEYNGGRFRVTAKIESVVIPGTVQEVIMARVDRLDEPTRRLLQVASVIGRNFYYPIVADILRRQGQVDEELHVELDLLKEKQLLLERKAHWTIGVRERAVSEELEYIFKHALAQETIYESILQKSRKEFHATVADAIESLFSERISDVYGMLAYHYSRADNLEKAEDYLFKAGEVAARSAASNEALNFFREASRIYLMLHPDGGDPQKRMLLEKNIALALSNRGSLTESIEHFDQALTYLGETVWTNTARNQVRVAFDLVGLLYFMYIRWGRRPGAPATDRDRQVFQIAPARAGALSTSDPRRMFIDNIWVMRRLTRFDPRTIEQACIIYSMTAAVFCFSGISFALSRRFLAIARWAMREGHVGDLFVYRAMESMRAYLAGDWDDRYSIEWELIDQVLRTGQLWDVNTYIGLNCDRKLRQGDFAVARQHLAKLAEISESYGYEFAQANHDGTLSFLLVEERKLDEALRAVDHYYEARHEDALKVLALGTKLKIQLLRGTIEDAAACVSKAEEVLKRSSDMAPWHRGQYAVARLRYETMRLEGAAGSGRSNRDTARAARTASRNALAIAAKVAGQRTEAYQLTANMWWALGHPRRAYQWWRRALTEGERLGARPEVARTYAAIAHRLATSPKNRTFDNIDAATAIENARTTFTELGLAWDLSQLPNPS